MRMRYISMIQANMKRYQTIHTRKATDRVLDGSYKSIFKGKSLNFDELREYVPGDDIRDMDWKASARSQKLLVRQYIAEKKHNVMLVMDTNARMLGDSEGLEEKNLLAILSAGTLAYFVNRNGDYVSATFATEQSIRHFPLKTGLGNIEMILEHYHKAVTATNHSDFNVPLDYIVHNIKRKMVVILVTDLQGIDSISEANLRRLVVAHDVLMLNISDADMDGGQVHDLSKNRAFVSFFAQDKKLAEKLKQKKTELSKRCMEKLKKYGIPCATIDYKDELDREIIDLLNTHKFEKI